MFFSIQKRTKKKSFSFYPRGVVIDNITRGGKETKKNEDENEERTKYIHRLLLLFYIGTLVLYN